MVDGDQTHSEVLTVRGGWERDPSHFPLPLTPAFASLYLPWQDAAFAAMFAEAGPSAWPRGAAHRRTSVGKSHFSGLR